MGSLPATVVGIGLGIAALLACRPVSALEVIELPAAGWTDATAPAATLPWNGTAAAGPWPAPGSILALTDAPLPAAEALLPPSGFAGPASAPPIPVPEPLSVLMLACGLLLIMPGTWIPRWYRLGDRIPLTARRAG
ncbi:putative secreted protein with PEP-CTERM sorting signal [Pseudoduganella lurida]|uniref:Putative secreted protein with PEP-CTERM sorting signal n=1 Tax=Pseudoduganella lurida TaxID=1036180 RepID=A0A562QXB4_9BURK|nr:hypothetical protein [Pseudoduganella lurida]TWI61459.1 putative secreted protein with PEP-CTERM sorting signal [Pseudoduganella lurida]